MEFSTINHPFGDLPFMETTTEENQVCFADMYETNCGKTSLWITQSASQMLTNVINKKIPSGNLILLWKPWPTDHL